MSLREFQAQFSESVLEVFVWNGLIESASKATKFPAAGRGSRAVVALDGDRPLVSLVPMAGEGVAGRLLFDGVDAPPVSRPDSGFDARQSDLDGAGFSVPAVDLIAARRWTTLVYLNGAIGGPSEGLRSPRSRSYDRPETDIGSPGRD